MENIRYKVENFDLPIHHPTMN